MSDAERLGLEMSRLRFVVGYFNESLPALVKAEPELQFAVVRLDGDTYLSTYEALAVLYPRLAPGGFLIVDDYVDWKTARAAVDDYRSNHGVTEQITLVPHAANEHAANMAPTSGQHVRGAYWRKQPAARQELCPGSSPGSLRPAGMLAGLTQLRRSVSVRDNWANELVEGVAVCGGRTHPRAGEGRDKRDTIKDSATSSLLNVWQSHGAPGSRGADRHTLDRWTDYARYYEAHLPKITPGKHMRLLELGVQSGGSARTWRRYYGESLYYVGVDINAKCKRSEVADEHTYIEIGSTLNSTFLLEVCKRHGPFDVIIDDGAHSDETIRIALQTLWPPKHACMARSDALYVIEDACTMMSASKQYVSTGPEAAPSEFLEIAAEAWWSMHHHWLSDPTLSTILAPVGTFAGARLQALNNGTGRVMKSRWVHPLFQELVRGVHLYDSLAFIVRGRHKRGDNSVPYV